MVNLFYFLAIVPLLYEGYHLTTPAASHKFVNNPKKDTFDLVWYFSFTLWYFVWNFVGLFSSQWPLFLLLLLLGLIPKKQVWYFWLDALVSLAIILFILLNAYHFHIDVWALLSK